MIELETRILKLSGLKPEYTVQTFTEIQIESKPYKVRTVYYTEPGPSEK